MMKSSFFRLISLLLFLSVALVGCGSGIDGDADIQYAALGASDAAGIGASSPNNGYVNLIKDEIENRGKSVNLMNYGVPDIEIGGIRDVELKALDAGYTPDIITLFTGTNDIISGATAAHFQEDLDAILNHLSKIEGARVFIADLPDLTALPRFQDDPDGDVTKARVQQFNDIISRVAARYGAVLISLASHPINEAEVSGDGLHPNNEGHRRLAEYFLQRILPYLYPDSSQEAQ